MWLSPSMMLMLISILSSIFLVASSPSLLISWVGLELNTMAFLPILLSKKNKINSEASIKYFLTQVLASILIILGACLLFLNIISLSKILILFSLFIKLGAAPFHSWILSIAESVEWGVLFLLLTIQKINPLILMWAFVTDILWLIQGVIIISLVVGGVTGLVHTSSRQLITFSSINHMGWLLMGMLFDLWVSVFYFFIYFLILLPVMVILNFFGTSHINEIFLANLSNYKQLLLFSSLLSLGGLPPFLGFLPKWIVLQNVVGGGYYLISLVMILMSLITLFFYLRLSFSSFIMGGLKVVIKNSYTYPFNNFHMYFLAFSLSGLPVFFLV